MTSPIGSGPAEQYEREGGPPVLECGAQPSADAGQDGGASLDSEPLTTKPARVIVCGGRHFHDYYRMANVLDRLHAIRPFWAVWHGNARGADSLAHRWCVERGVKVFPVPAEWSKHGKRAGPIRNQNMLGNSIDLVIAFPGGRGTEDMVERARAAGVLVTRARAKTTLRLDDDAGHCTAITPGNSGIARDLAPTPPEGEGL